jgi:hypothetical protein
MLGRVAQARQRVVDGVARLAGARVVHVVDEDDVGAHVEQRVACGDPAVDHAGDLKAHGLLEGEPDGVRDQRVVGDDQ